MVRCLHNSSSGLVEGACKGMAPGRGFSPTYERLGDYLAGRMRMSPIDQPLMLMELLGRRSPAPAQDIARRILGEDVTQIDTYVQRVLTGNGITAYGNDAYSLIGGLPGLTGWADRSVAVSESRADRGDSRGWRRCRFFPPPPSSRARMGIF
ncbi:hypothetical protein FB106_112106 [Synechococcus sp. Ace-Pa]|nr:hypothetical protein FB106_112106 [Synechococcus sp. Ace-Pa]